MPITIFGISVSAAVLSCLFKCIENDIRSRKRRKREEKERENARLVREAKEALIPSRSISVLGLNGAGKTSLLMALGAKLSDTTTTGTLRVETYQSFKIKVNGEDKRIKKGKDIGGGESFITADISTEESYLQFIVRTKDIILFLFDVNAFIEKPEGYNQYRQDNLARLNIIFQAAKENQKTGSIKLFATHKNEFVNNGGNEKNVIERIREMARIYDSEPLFDNLKVIDTNDLKDIQVVKESIFS